MAAPVSALPAWLAENGLSLANVGGIIRTAAELDRVDVLENVGESRCEASQSKELLTLTGVSHVVHDEGLGSSLVAVSLLQERLNERVVLDVAQLAAQNADTRP